MDDSRRILEACINEFFAPSTSNDRKRQIEVMLDNFSKQVGAWKQALYFLSASSSNQYVVMFCLNVIENSIKCRWLTSMSPPEHNELKSTLYTFLIQETNSKSSIKNPHFVRNKIVKLLTDVGKFAWPHSYPDFFANVFQILEGDDTVVIGLVFLKTISEEWSVIKDEVITDRKNELRVLLVEQVKGIFDALHRILLAALKQRSVMVPSSSNSCLDAENSPPVHSQLDEIIALTLETAAHYCSWIPLDGVVPNLSDSKLKTPPFGVDFVQLLCQISLANLADGNNSGNQISSLGLGALNELLYRKFIPKEFDDQLNFIVRFGVELLNKLLNNRPGIPSLETQYVEKVIEFLCLVASAHFHRLDEMTAKAFMTLLLPFTFKQEETAFYYDCLEIWARLLDHLNAQIPIMNVSPSREDFLNQIKQPIMGLASGIIHSNAKFTFIYDDYYTNDEDEESAVPGISRNIDVLVKIGELLPAESLQSVTSTWSDSCRFYLGLQNHINEAKTVIRMENPNEIEHFNFVVQLIGRVANIFYGDVFRNELSLGKSIFQQLVGLSVFSRNYYFVQSPHQIAQSNLELISALKTWTYWLSRYHAEVILADSTLGDQHNFFEILGLLIDNVFFALENRESIENDILSLSAHFFATLVGAVRTQYVFQHPSVQALIVNIHNLRASVDADTYRILNKAVSGILVLPWYNVSRQEWDTRTQLYTAYMKKLTSDLIIDSRGAVNLIVGLHILNDQLSMLSTECGTSKKVCWGVMKELVPYVQDLSLGYLRLPNICEELLTFFLKIMEVLQQQAGAAFFEQAVRNFLTYFSTENIIDDLLQEHENATYVVEKFLQMLQYMVKDSSPSFKKFLPDALSICYDHIYPIISARSSPDLKVPFFSLIRDAVNYRWLYFFPSLVLQSNALGNSQHHVYSAGGSASHFGSIGGFGVLSNHGHGHSPSHPRDSSHTPKQDLVATKRLDQILQSVGQSFLQADLELFRFNLSTLSIWNEKHNFFSKLATQFPEIFDQFIMVLFQVLVQKSHDLLCEDVSHVLYEMAKVDYSNFYQVFLPTFLSSNFLMLSKEQRENLIGKFRPSTRNRTFDLNGGHRGGGNDENNGAMDSPTFTIMLSKFIDDLRFFHFVLDCDRINNSSQNTSDDLSKSP